MVLNLVLGVVLVALGVLLMIVGDTWGLIVGIIPILMGLVLLLRAYRSRTTVA